MKKMIMEFVRRDTFDRPVYKCDGRYYVDTDPRTDACPAAMFTKSSNNIDGEPDWPVRDCEFEFVPKRDTWWG